MTHIIHALSEISDRYDALFCDLWGCLHDGVRAFPEAVAALQKYKMTGGKVVLLTNSPRPRDQVAVQLDGLGVPRDCWDEIATSGDSAQTAMLAGMVGTRVWHLGPERDLGFFEDLPDGADKNAIERVSMRDAEGIVCTGLLNDETETPEDYRGQLLSAKARGLKLLCANPDVVVDRGEKRVFCAGAIAELYTEMGGESLYFGKPHPPIYDLARNRLARLGAVPDDRILAIGDGPGTDVAGAIADNLDCLFVTGGLSASQTGTNRDPDPEMLTNYLAEILLSPIYSIGNLR